MDLNIIEANLKVEKNRKGSFSTFFDAKRLQGYSADEIFVWWKGLIGDFGYGKGRLIGNIGNGGGY